MNPKLKHTLDSLLRIHFDPEATDGEKNNSLAMFKKKCAKNDIDADFYLSTSSANPNRGKSSSRNKNEKSNKQRNEKSNKQQKTGSSSQSYSWEWTFNEKYRTNRRRDEDLLFEVKEPMFEVKVHNGKRVILLNVLARKAQTNDRFGIVNFCLYSEGFNPEQLTQDKHYIFYSTGVRYFRDHYIINKIVEVDFNDWTTTGRIIF